MSDRKRTFLVLSSTGKGIQEVKPFDIRKQAEAEMRRLKANGVEQVILVRGRIADAKSTG